MLVSDEMAIVPHMSYKRLCWRRIKSDFLLRGTARNFNPAPVPRVVYGTPDPFVSRFF
jgi:hypothetical protein